MEQRPAATAAQPRPGGAGSALPPPAPAPVISCPDCATLQRLPAPRRGAQLRCRCCGRRFSSAVPASSDTALALLLAALLLWAPACLAPLMSVEAGGAVRTTGLAGCVQALWAAGYAPLAVLVGALMILVPSAYLGLLTLVLLRLRIGATPRARWPAHLLRLTGELQPWLMLEVFLIGGCVAYTRMQSVAEVSLGLAGWCLLGCSLLLLGTGAVLDRRALWRALPAPAAVPARAPRNALACSHCELLLAPAAAYCPRCGARAAARKAHALQRTTALVLTGLLLYIPANLLPVISIERYGVATASTILGGVRELIQSGLWLLAAIVFTASVVVPLVKLGSLAALLWFTARGSAGFLPGRTRVYRVVDAIGRWSNIDVFMISLLVALVQFGALSHVKVESGAVAFAAVVVITMLAARTFDPRVMWDRGAGRAAA